MHRIESQLRTSWLLPLHAGEGTHFGKLQPVGELPLLTQPWRRS